MAFKKLIACPSCKFTNRSGDARCLICKSPLPPSESQRIAAPVLDDPSATAPAPPRTGEGRPPPAPPARRPGPPSERVPPSARETAPRRVVSDAGPALAAGAPAREELPERPRSPSARYDKAALDPAKVIAWVCCDPLPPIPLGPRPILTIGRHQDCDLVLPHREVSRQHAVIKVRGTTLMYEDGGSSNGSYVNGNRTAHTVLRVGDKLTIGPYELELRSKEAMAARHHGEGSTASMELTSVARVNPLAAMTGKLEEVPLTEVLQGIEFNKKSGTLSVSGDGLQGVLVVSDGRPMYATWGALRDDEAVIAMVGARRGRFSFSGALEPGERTMRTALTPLLFEASRRIDEASSEATVDGPLGDLAGDARDDGAPGEAG